jgi:hypothetical protein
MSRYSGAAIFRLKDMPDLGLVVKTIAMNIICAINQKFKTITS